MFTYFYSCICVSLKVCSSSLEKAKQIARAQPLVSSSAEIFIGQKNFKNLDSEDLQLLHQCTTDNWPTQEQDRVAIHFRSIFMPNHGHKGMLYRVGEAVLVRNSRSDTQQSVVVYLQCDVAPATTVSSREKFTTVKGTHQVRERRHRLRMRPKRYEHTRKSRHCT